MSRRAEVAGEWLHTLIAEDMEKYGSRATWLTMVKAAVPASGMD